MAKCSTGTMADIQHSKNIFNVQLFKTEESTMADIYNILLFLLLTR